MDKPKILSVNLTKGEIILLKKLTSFVSISNDRVLTIHAPDDGMVEIVSSGHGKVELSENKYGIQIKGKDYKG